MRNAKNFILIFFCLCLPGCGGISDLPSNALSRPDVDANNWSVEINNGLRGEKLNVICFLDDLTGYGAGENGVFRTSDGGKVWKKLTINLPLKSSVTNIGFFDDKNGLIVAQRYQGVSSDNLSVVFRTSDSGETWEAVYSGSYLGTGSLKLADGVAWFIANGIFKYDREFKRIPSGFNRETDGEEVWDCLKNGWFVLDADRTKFRVVTPNGVVCTATENGFKFDKNLLEVRPTAAFGVRAAGVESDGLIWFVRGSGTTYHGINGMFGSEAGIQFASPPDTFFADAIYVGRGIFVLSGEEVKTLKDPRTGETQESRAAIIWVTADGGKTLKEIIRKADTPVFQLHKPLKGTTPTVRGFNGAGEMISIFR